MAEYHRGETAVQARAGLTSQATFSLGGIGDTIPDVAAAFLAEQPLLVLGGTDPVGRVWATMLTGPPGFLRADTPRSLTIDALPAPGDPLLGTLTDPPAPVHLGLIAIEPATRRRMRMNGRAVPHGRGLRVELDQVIANCPKYIQKRQVHGTAGPSPDTRTVTDGSALTEAQQRVVRSADTFFVATASDTGEADASHRGGNPGFVDVPSPTLLRWPDYPGNNMFLTLGNLATNPAAGLLVPHWETGTTLHLTGTAETLWADGTTPGDRGVPRMVEFRITTVREIAGASSLRWGAPHFSRFNPPVR
ncbi:pyridoxamine 5-phosphate oxidase [Wenjunlia vitaminophila]|uniref:Pyridoxamine 5-phosphate oxidase n=1 Tax=Wenjunlia vitaminophila TaxID=76728 RepID=A0A0T6LK19_WENVI|nr:pyridoxamine 5'-phosphate oxidase family protein [Wenjunlia vitaminophila]KRV46373.1 pyridoxamine 5-phosphate oxidase [Wenjunlia vitaminophila]